jgi:hypothetical protein
MARELIFAGMRAALNEIRNRRPHARTSAGWSAWYRSRMRAKGLDVPTDHQERLREAGEK